MVRLIGITLLLQILTPFSSAFGDSSVTAGLGISYDPTSCSNVSGTSLLAVDSTTINATLGSAAENKCTPNKGILLQDYGNSASASADVAYVQAANTGTPGDRANPTGDMTVEAWVYVAVVHGTNLWNIIATRWFDGSSATADWHFGLYNSHLLVCLTAGNCSTLYQSNTVLTNNRWYEVGFTLVNPSVVNANGSCPTNCGTLTYYLNGVADGSYYGVQEGHTADGKNDLQLGDNRPYSQLGLEGYLGRFRIYNRALSAAEMNQNYRYDANAVGVAAAPYLLTNPAIFGSATYNQNETTTTGTWLNSPTSYTYQWMRASTANGTYVPISGATSSTYLTVSADVGKYLEVMDTATNTSGSTPAISAPSPVIARAGSTLSFSTTSQFPIYRTTNNLTINTNGAIGYVNFTIGGKTIPGCKKVLANAGNSYLAICPWKPSVHASVNISAQFTPTDSNYTSSQSSIGPLVVKPRATTR